jgi:hypothetical protein
MSTEIVSGLPKNWIHTSLSHTFFLPAFTGSVSEQLCRFIFEGRFSYTGCHWPVFPLFGVFFVCFIFETRSHYVAQASLKLVILLPPPLKYWDYRIVPPCLAFYFSNGEKCIKFKLTRHCHLLLKETRIISVCPNVLRPECSEQFISFPDPIAEDFLVTGTRIKIKRRYGD